MNPYLLLLKHWKLWIGILLIGSLGLTIVVMQSQNNDLKQQVTVLKQREAALELLSQLKTDKLAAQTKIAQKTQIIYKDRIEYVKSHVPVDESCADAMSRIRDTARKDLP